MSKIIAKTYKYRRNANGSVQRVGNTITTECPQKNWGQLKVALVKKARNKPGVNVKFKKHQRITIATKPKIDHLYQKTGANTFTKTYYTSKRTARINRRYTRKSK